MIYVRVYTICSHTNQRNIKANVVLINQDKYHFLTRWSLRSFFYLGNRLYASGGSEAAVTARTRIGWIKF